MNNREDAIRIEMEQGIKQVDPTLKITDFATYFDKEKRQLTVGFVAKNPTDETVEVNVAYGE